MLDSNLVGSLGVTGQKLDAEGVVAAIEMLRTAFPDYHSTTEELIVQDDWAVARWTTRGTHLGDLSSALSTIRPIGKKVEYSGVSFVRVAGGKVVEFLAMSDNLTLMQQLGVIPSAVAAER